MLRAVKLTLLVIIFTLLLISVTSTTWTDVPFLFSFQNGLWSHCLYSTKGKTRDCQKIPENKVTQRLKVVRAFSIISVILTFLSIILLFIPKVNFYVQISLLILNIASIIISTIVYSEVAKKDITWDPDFKNQVINFGRPSYFGNGYWTQVTSAILLMIVLVVFFLTNKKKEILF